MGLRESLETRIAQLERERVQLREVLAIIRDKIAKADEKYYADRSMSSFHKWNSILSGLEEELDKTRALLVACEAELEQKRRKLAERGYSSEPTSPETASEEETVSAFGGSVAGSEAPKRVISETASVLSQTAASKVVPVEAATVKPDTSAGPAGGQRVVATAAVESPRPAANGGSPAKSAEPETNVDEALAVAMDRVLGGRLAEVTLGDFDRMLDRYVAILHRPSPSPEEQKLEEALAASIRKADQELSRLRRKWIPYAPVGPE